MKHLLPILLSITIAACGDHLPPIDTIEGRWYSSDPYEPEWTYDFQRGITTFSTPAYTKTFVYAERSDTLYLGGDGHTDPRIWLLRFEHAGRIQVDRVGYPIYRHIVLERVQE